MDAGADQSADRTELKQHGENEQDRNVHIQIAKRQEQGAKHGAAEDEADGKPGYDVTQKALRDVAFIVACAIKDHFEEHFLCFPLRASSRSSRANLPHIATKENPIVFGKSIKPDISVRYAVSARLDRAIRWGVKGPDSAVTNRGKHVCTHPLHNQGRHR